MPKLGVAMTNVNIPTILSGTFNWNPASLANGANVSQDVTVAGAAVGDAAVAGFTSIATAGWRLTASVRVTNTVSCMLTNNTGGAVDLPAGTLTAVVLKL